MLKVGKAILCDSKTCTILDYYVNVPRTALVENPNTSLLSKSWCHYGSQLRNLVEHQNSHFVFFNNLRRRRRRHRLCSVCIGLVRFWLSSLVRQKTTAVGSLLVACELTVWSVVSCFNISGHFFTKYREHKTRYTPFIAFDEFVNQWFLVKDMYTC